jgi:hypothetical protein
MGPSLQPVRVDPKPGSETNRPLFQPPLKAGEIEGGIEARARCGRGGGNSSCVFRGSRGQLQIAKSVVVAGAVKRARRKRKSAKRAEVFHLGVSFEMSASSKASV